MLNLSELAFKVNTDALVQAAEKIAALGKSVEDLQGSFSKLERGSAASEKALAEANKKNAQAAKANAEAALLQAKALTEVERAENLKVKTIQESTKATEESTRSVSSNVSVLQRQSDIYGFMIEGFSKGQSSILATAKAAGIAAEEMKNLQDVLQAQRTIMGGDPFDKSLGSLKSLQNEFKVLKEVQRLYTAEIPLTRKQMENLALDKLRLVEAMKAQGKSFSEIKAELQNLNAEYIATAGGINRLVQAENQIDKAHKDTANANAYLEKEMQRVNYALQAQNNELNKGTANALFRFEQNLKRSGLTLAEQKKKLDDYRTSLLALEKAKGSTQTDYISRALGPQITDIFVGLATGQSPLTVMLQQGGQLRDQLAQAGVAAEDMGNTMRTAARSMVTSVAAVAGAFKDLLVGAFLDAGAALTNIVVQGSGFNIVLDKAKAKLAAGGEQNFKYIGTLTRMGEVFRVAVGASLAASTAALLAFGVAMVQVMKAQDAMTIALVSTGASLGITTNQATEMAKAVDRTGASFSGVLDIFAMIAEKGNISAEAMQKITEAALKLEAVGGASVEKTVEQFSKLADDPVKALSEYTQATGLLTQAEIARIETLVELGQETTAVKEATEMLSAAKQKEAALIYAGLSPLSRVWLDIKNGIKEAWGSFQEFTGSSALVTVLKNALQVVAVIATEVWFAVKGIGESLGGLGAVAAAVMTDIKNLDTNFTSSKNVLGLIKETDEARKVAYKDAIDRIMQQGAYEQSELEKTAQAQAKVNKENSDAEKERLAYQAAMKPWKEAEQKGAKDLLTRQQFINKAIEDANKGLKEGTSLREKDVALIQKMAGLEWDKANKSKKDPSENYYATLLRDSTNATIKADEATQDLTKSQLKMLEVIKDPRFAKLSEERQTTVLRNYAVAASNERIVEGQELINKLLGKGEGLGKEYYATLAKLEALKGNAGIDQEQLEKALQALRDTTPEAKRVREEIKAAAEAYNQYSANATASLESTKLGNQQLDYRLSVLGKSTEEQRKMKIQQDASVKLMQAEVKYAKEVLKIRQDTKLQNDPMLMAKALQDAEAAYAEERKLINREVAVEAAEDFQKEFDRISNGVTDSIVTALFEGGKSGSKKLRDLIVAELKKPVTLVVSAVVNTLLGNILGGLMGGSANAATGGSDLVGTVSNISSAYRAATGFNTGWLTDFGSTLPGSIASTGANLYSKGFETIGSGMMDFGNSIAQYADAINTAGDVLGYGAAIFAAANGKWGQAIGSAVGTYFGGPIGSFIGSTIGKWADEIFSGGAGTPHTGGGLIYSAAKGIRGGAGNYNGTTFGMGVAKEYNPEVEKLIGPLAIGLVTTLDGVAKTFGKTAGYEIATAFADDTSKDGAWGSLRISKDGQKLLDWQDTRTSRWAPKEFGDGEEGYKQYLAALAKDTRQVLLNMDLPSWADQILTDLGESASIESLSAAIQQIGVIKGVFNTLTNTLVELSGASDETLAALMTLSGGIEALRANATTYYQNFYSAEEQRANVQKQLAKSFKELGRSMIDIDATDARQQFRDLVEAQDLTTESGRKVYAALLAISGTFASVTTEVTGSITTVADALNKLRNETRSVEDIAQNILRLEQAVFEAQNSGNIEVLRNNILQGLTAQERVLQRQLWAIENTRTAQEKLVSAYKGQVTALDSSINRLRTYADSLKKFKESLTLGELSPLTPSEQYAEAKRQYESNLALAMVGDVGAQNALQGSITAFLQASRTYNASSSQYTSDFNTAQAGLDFIASITQDQANNEQILRDAAVSQLELLGSIDNSVTEVGELISSGLIELSNAILTGLSLGITPNQGVLDAVNNGLGGGQLGYYGSFNITKSQSNQPIAAIPVNQASAMQSDSQGLVSLNSQLVEEVRNLTAQVTLLRSERQQDTRSQTQILATATTEAGTAVTEAINKSNYTQEVRTGAKLN